MVVNRLAAEQMGFSNPAEAIGKQVRLNQFGLEIGMLPATIVGVVENSRFRSLREPVEAMMFYDRGIYWNLIVRYDRSEEHTSELQSLMRISYAVFCLKKKKINYTICNTQHTT